MAPRPKRRFWRVCRIYFRRFRITVWLLVLTLVCSLFYFNQVGLPDFLKRPLLQRLREHGVDLQFSRLRLSWYRGLVAENVRFGRSDDPLTPQLTAAEVQVTPNYHALTHFQFTQIDALVLRHGRLVWPIADSSQPEARELSVTNLQAILRLLPNDEWALDKFQGNFAGATFQLSGTITNASAIRDWKVLHGPAKGPPTAGGVWQERLRHFADSLERIQFAAPPDLRLDLRGDARDVQSFGLRMTVSAPGARTPWGDFSQGHFTARLIPAVTNEISQVELTLEAAEARTRWAVTSDLHLAVHLASLIGPTNAVDGNLILTAGQVHTQWASATNAQLTAQWVHALTNPIPLAGSGHLRVEQGSTAWGRARDIELRGTFTHAGSPPPPGLAAWGFWSNLQPYEVAWQAGLTDLQATNLLAESVACSGSWSAPQLAVTNLNARLYQGLFHAEAGLDVATRLLSARLSSDFDPHQLAPLLPEPARPWLARFSWEQAPALFAQGALTLPAWTNAQPDWRVEVWPTLQVQGEFNFPRGLVCSNTAISAVRSHFSCTNRFWRLPDLSVARPEGELRASLEASEVTQAFHGQVASTLNPLFLRPLLGTNEQRAFDLAGFTQPPELAAELWGRFNDLESLGGTGRLHLTNFTFRGQAVTSLDTAVQYTNRVVCFLQPRITRGEQVMTADALTADFNQQLIFLTNGFSTGEPLFVARAIGPQIVKAIEPYRFLVPPTSRVHGVIPMHGEEGADLHFDVAGGPFQWMKFNIPHLTGHLHWRGEQLTLTNVTAEFYGGLATGDAHFEFWPGGGADYSFSLSTSDTQLQKLLNDLNGRTNTIEGRLTGILHITKANTEDPQHVQGYGSASLRDGLIWEIPLFGMFSRALNDMIPGLGSSRFSAGTGTFTITNSVIRSEDLEMRSPSLRLLYRGTVDFDYRVNARVEAELWRDMWLVGPIVNALTTPMTKLFVYHVTGTLSEPKKEPEYLATKIFQAPFQMLLLPFRGLHSLFPEEGSSSRTNAPAAGPK